MTRKRLRWLTWLVCACALTLAIQVQVHAQAQQAPDTPTPSTPSSNRTATKADARARARAKAEARAKARAARAAKAAKAKKRTPNAHDAGVENAPAPAPANEPAAQRAPEQDRADAADGSDAPQTAKTAAAQEEEAKGTSLPPEHTPQLTLRVDPEHSVKVGEVAHVEISAEVPVGDDVTVTDQSFSPFEVNNKDAHVEQPSGDRQRFVFKLELLALEAGDEPIPAIALRVVTKDNTIGTVRTEPYAFKVQSLIANEPNAQPKDETAPVVVLEDNYLPLYLLGALALALVVAGLTVLVSRYLQRRKAAAVPPPPPRPPWDIAVEELGKLRRRKQSMLDAGQGAVFVDQLSDVVRAYLGGRYAFDGLETTTDEMVAQLKTRGAPLGFTQEVLQFLGRCDLVKFAKVEPDGDEVDLLFAKAQDLVQLSEPERLQQSAPNDPAHVGALQPTPPRRSQRPGGPADPGDSGDQGDQGDQGDGGPHS